ncbi:MAG: hypothetical protein S4CHLAM20_10590 [Chlamydiia bacterium]|nr:hypothetical protein [Chlamydiia bacterium]
MAKYCDHLDIPFTEKMFTWKKHDESFDLHIKWHEQKKKHVTKHWHDRALQTSSIGKKTTYIVDELGNPTFEEIKNEKDRELFKQYYRENLIYYNKFLEVEEDFLLVK